MKPAVPTASSMELKQIPTVVAIHVMAALWVITAAKAAIARVASARIAFAHQAHVATARSLRAKPMWIAEAIALVVPVD